jgi:molybdopterin converting factor small subunit
MKRWRCITSAGDRITTQKELRVLYYAVFREATGVSEETVRSAAPTAADLYLEISRTYGIPYDLSMLTVALNDQVVPWSSPLGDGDTVVFLAPFAGG